MSDQETKNPPDPEMKLRRKAAQAIAFEIWRQDFRRAHPEATRDERDQAWEEARSDELKKARRVLSALERGGFRVVRDAEESASRSP